MLLGTELARIVYLLIIGLLLLTDLIIGLLILTDLIIGPQPHHTIKEATQPDLTIQVLEVIILDQVPLLLGHQGVVQVQNRS